MRYEFLEHTGDFKLRAYGASREEVFVNAALGMTEFMFGKSIFSKNSTEQETISVESSDVESLLVDWLSRILFLTTTRYRAYISIMIKTLSDTRIVAEARSCEGKAVDDIKAVTYNDLSIKEKNGAWQATVIFDI